MGFGFLIVVIFVIAFVKLLSSATRTQATSLKQLNPNQLHSKGSPTLFSDDDYSAFNPTFDHSLEPTFSPSVDHEDIMGELPSCKDSDYFTNQTIGLIGVSDLEPVSSTDIEINPTTGLPMLGNSMVDVAGNIYGTHSTETFSDVSHADAFDHSLDSSSDGVSSFDSTLDDQVHSGFDDHFSSSFDDDKW